MNHGNRRDTGFIGCSQDSASQFHAVGLSGHHVEAGFHGWQKFLAVVRWPIFDQSGGSLMDGANNQPPARVLEDEDDLIKFGWCVESHYAIPRSDQSTQIWVWANHGVADCRVKNAWHVTPVTSCSRLDPRADGLPLAIALKSCACHLNALSDYFWNDGVLNTF